MKMLQLVGSQLVNRLGLGRPALDPPCSEYRRGDVRRPAHTRPGTLWSARLEHGEMQRDSCYLEALSCMEQLGCWRYFRVRPTASAAKLAGGKPILVERWQTWRIAWAN